MIFSTRSTYGLRAMINLAKQQKSGSVSLAMIARQEQMSLKYLERLFSGLKKAGLVKAAKGASGGYSLARSARQINVHDIVKALEGELNVFHCTGEKEKIYCSQQCRCEVNHVLFRVEQAITKTLKGIRLSQLV
ncbi:MAG: Rrf2 family transcriptional regulator [Patescibacteria group bacterium]|nr:Rrf2 family transcriptional regulator [Patescibacteria group bacterium]